MADPTKIRTFRASDADWQRWTEAARRAGMTRSEWIRRALDEAAMWAGMDPPKRD